MRHRAERLVGQITTALLVLLGVTSILIVVADFFFPNLTTMTLLRDTEQLTFLLVGALCLALGLERVTSFELLQRRMDDLVESTNSLAPALVLSGRERIYNAAGEMIQDASRIVRASAFRLEHSAAPSAYLDSIARRMRAAKHDSAPIEYRLLYGYEDQSAVADAHRKHEEFFQKEGVAECFVSRFLATPTGLDLLIIDDDQLLIALPTVPTDPSLRGAVRFINVPGLVNDVRTWYDEYLWRSGESSVPAQEAQEEGSK